MDPGCGAREVDSRGTPDPVQNWLDRVARTDRVAVLGVRIRYLDDLAASHGYGSGAGFDPATFGL